MTHKGGRLIQSLKAHASHAWRFVKAVNRHPRVPKWIKYMLGVLLIIPGPVDEFLALIVLVGIGCWKREIVRECWHTSAIPSKED